MHRRRKILVVGGGGREHALCWRLRQSRACGEILCAPGNPGIAALAGVRCVPVSAMDIARLRELARREAVDLVVVGPEAPLSAGLVDGLRADRPRALLFGPSAAAAEIESSKVFAKGFMTRHRIATAAYGVARSVAESEAFLLSQPGERWVIKADGLCAGKGVTVCADRAEARAAAQAALAVPGGRVVIEERLVGREASVMALVSGESVAVLPPCEDHKTIGEGDVGLMTGGMGAVCPTGVVDEAALQAIERDVLLPAAAGLRAEGRPFCGLLYAGVMLTADGPRVLEFNCRFGDPETQALLMMLEADVLPLLEATAAGKPLPPRVPAGPGAAVCVVLAAAGYPGTPRTGDAIRIGAVGDAVVFHAGTALGPTGLVSAGGRVLGVGTRGDSVEAARAGAYRALGEIHLAGGAYRRDIGARG